MRRKSHIQLIDSVSPSASSQSSQVVFCDDPVARYADIAWVLTAGAATLVGNIQLVGGADPAKLYPLLTGTLLSPAATGVATTSLGTDGKSVFSTAPNGSFGVLRIPEPPPYIGVIYTYASGGGANRMQIKAVY